MNGRRVALVVIALHALVLVVHDRAHHALPVPLSGPQTLFASAVIVVGPLVAGWLIWRRTLVAGGTLLAVSMFGALVFGVVNHYLLVSPDNVATMPATGWGRVFVASAHAMTVLEAVGVVVGLGLARSPRSR